MRTVVLRLRDKEKSWAHVHARQAKKNCCLEFLPPPGGGGGVVA
jgi:hypothetical protein